MESVPVFRVNAFTDRLFHGNPAGVCITQEPLPETLMQSIAAEMAVSETAFVSLQEMTLRWFTPLQEVSLCGHATLSAAYILYTLKGFDTKTPISFQSRGGPLTVRAVGDLIEMDFPLLHVTAQKADRRLLNALGIGADDILFEGMAGKRHLMHVKNEVVLNSVSPDFSTMCKLAGRGIILTASSSNPDYDFVSRYFAPWVGVNEDPVTGSAHCALMPYWQKRNGKSRMFAHQNSRRGGEVMMVLGGDRVVISGKAVLAFQGELCLGG